MIAPTASAVASQMRKRTTATERNRACDAINAYRSDLLKKLKGLRLVTVTNQAIGVAAAGARGSATRRIFSR